MTFNPGANVRLAKRAEQFYSIIADGKELITENSKGILVVPELKDGSVKVAFKPDVSTFFDTFFGCVNLVSIPEDLFANNPNVISFGYTVEEAACDLWKFENDPDFTGDSAWQYGPPSLFGSCDYLAAIPEKLFANNTKVRRFGLVFAACAGITSIPEKLFANNPDVTDFVMGFHACSSLQSIPARLFDNNRKATMFDGCFNMCESLTGESPYTMIGDKKVHLYERSNYPDHFATPIRYFGCFNGCTGLTDYAQIPSDWK